MAAVARTRVSTVFSGLLGTPTDGTYADGKFPFVAGVTSVDDAVDFFNQQAAGDLLTCPATVSIGDVVYISGSGAVDKAFAAPPTPTPDAIGFVTKKPTATTCRVENNGLSPSIYVGLVPGSTYYLSDVTPGAITLVPPSASGSTVQEVGTAASPTQLIFNIDATAMTI
jgi:hypothetical protein